MRNISIFREILRKSLSVIRSAKNKDSPFDTKRWGWENEARTEGTMEIFIAYNVGWILGGIVIVGLLSPFINWRIKLKTHTDSKEQKAKSIILSIILIIAINIIVSLYFQTLELLNLLVMAFDYTISGIIVYNLPNFGRRE